MTTLASDQGGNFKLASTQAAGSALSRCWDSSVYLPVMAPKFLKLSLQILARYSTGVARTVANIAETSTVSSDTLSQTNKKSPAAADDDEGVEEEVIDDDEATDDQDPVLNLIRIQADVSALTPFVTSFVEETVLPALTVDATADATTSTTDDVRKCFGDSCTSLQAKLTDLAACLTRRVVDKCLPSLKQVADIPRLYRYHLRDHP